jgi:hypothetical protein
MRLLKIAASSLYYHVTLTSNLPSILEEGLKPGIGGRSEELGEEKPAIYLFGSVEDAKEAVSNWLGDEFEETESLALLEINLPSSIQPVKQAFEFQVFEDISPEHIKVISKDF